MNQDTERLEDQAMRVVKLVDHLRLTPGSPIWLVPERFQKVMDCLYGAVRQQVRLAREIDQMRERGQIECDVFVDEVNRTAVET